MFYSPLRYPGGKSKLSAYVQETITLNELEGGSYVEPFAGGAAIAWHLLINKHVSNVYINDLNSSIYSFWFSVIHRTDELCKLIRDTPVSIEEWHKQKMVQVSENASTLELGFSTFFLNRTNRSGIVKGGVIGGLSQEGNYKLDCRFNKDELIKRIERIASYRDHIFIFNRDAVEFIDEILPDIEEKTLVNIDPPYYIKGKGLYQNFLSHDDHFLLYEHIKQIKQPWIVTYDDTPEINQIYSEFNPKPYGLTYTAQTKKKGAEVLVLDPRISPCTHKPDITFKELKRIKRESPKLPL